MKNAKGQATKTAAKKQNKTVKTVLIVLIALVLLGAIVAIAAVGAIAGSVRLQTDKLVKQSPTATVVAMDGDDISSAAGYTPLREIPLLLQHAFVAVEDKRFYQHNGLDYHRIAGAIVTNIKSGSFAQGASTISCQLIKNTHLDNSKTISRKIKEAKLARELEKNYSKSDILEMYLNVIYFGNGIYGVGEASRRFFGKTPSCLSPAECASLAAVPVNPAQYSPLRNYDNNRRRSQMVLRLMLEQEYINQEQYDQWIDVPVQMTDKSDDVYQLYRHNALLEASQVTGLSVRQLAADGYVIYTYCDRNRQQKAAELYADQLLVDDTTGTNVDSCALVCDNDSGGIRAYYGTTALPIDTLYRQPGSLIKPFVYAEAVRQNKLLPATMIVDEPTTFGDYTPSNYHDIYYGPIAAATALAKSSNIAAVKVLTYAGVDEAYQRCCRFGLPLVAADKHLAMALGGLTNGVTPKQLLSAYATLARGGRKTTARFVHRITDAHGHVIYRNEPDNERVVDPETAFLVTDMLRQTVVQGTARQLGELSIPIAAKTGTVAAGQYNSDAWCAAYTPTDSVIVWAGNLSMKKENMISLSGGGTPCTLARELLRGVTQTPFAIPDGIVLCQLDEYARQQQGLVLRAGNNTPARYRIDAYCKRSCLPPRSTVFDEIVPVDANWAVHDGDLQLNLRCAPLCSYYLYYSDGGGWELFDTLSGDEIIQKQYAYRSGLYRIQPVLHGQIDIDGIPYDSFIF